MISNNKEFFCTKHANASRGGVCEFCVAGELLTDRIVSALDIAKAHAGGGQSPAGGMKFDGGKPRWSLLMQGCANALAGVAAVLTFGAKKYAAHSWKQVENNAERYRDAMYRHLNAIESGEILDPESGLPHWDHVACNALFLAELNKEDSK